VGEPAGTDRARWSPDWSRIVFTILGVAYTAVLLVWLDAFANLWPALARGGIGNALPFLVALGLAAWGFVLGGRVWKEAYLATLVVLAPLVAFLAGVAIVLAYLPNQSWSVPNPVFLGITVGLGAWVFLAPQFLWVSRVDTAQPRSFGELVQRTRRAADFLAAAEQDPRLQADATERGISPIWAQATTAVETLRLELGLDDHEPKAGFRYAFAVGYMNLWRALHRAEEAVLAVEPEPEAFAAAMYDASRLQGTPNGDRLIQKIHKALSVFGERARPAICNDLIRPERNEEGQKTARAVLVEVRHAFNVYEDDTWERLIRQRNRLLRTVLVTSVVAVLLVSLAVLRHADTDQLAVACGFYLVGALAGLFGRLRVENSAGPALDDYGLFETRLLATILLSGLAAIGGAVLVQFQLKGGSGMDLSAAFSLTNTAGWLAAAAFGLTPELVTGSLTKQSDATLRELTSAQAAPG
jgi:hypothetical protein